MKTFSALIALALVAFATASAAPAFAKSSTGTNSYYSVPSSLGSADRFGEASQQ
jgi:hypothetical protein